MAYQPLNSWTPTSNDEPRQHAYKPSPTIEAFEVDPVPSYCKPTFRQKYLSGLKITLNAFVSVACVILAINTGWLGYAKRKYGIVDGYGTIQHGDCASVKKLDTWLHLAINILSTLLLTGSNAFMMAYSSPTRKEVDQAHARRRWLHVGSMSLRNMRGIAKRKSIIVLILAASCIPFHLLYNSLVFTSLSSNDYYWTVVTPGFLTGDAFNLTGPAQWINAGYPDSGQYFYFSASLPDGGDDASDDDISDTMYSYFDQIQQSAPTWERLDQQACIKAYASAFVSLRRNVVLVSTSQNSSNSVLSYGSSDFNPGELDSNWWICSEGRQDGPDTQCNPLDYVANASSWQVNGHSIDHCLSERVEDACTLQFSLDIMIIVVVFNAIKVLGMGWILLRLDAGLLLTSIGDAVASFILRPDPTTGGMCLANRRYIDHFWRTAGVATQYGKTSVHRWGQAISVKRWIMFFLMMISSFLGILFFGTWGFVHVRDRGIKLNLTSLWDLGFGDPNQAAMVIYGGGGNVVTMSILANIPQVILAVIYLVYSGIMTAMFNAADWAEFAAKSQTLMVSTPRAKQRGTWLLGAPFAYAIVLVALQTLLHWFVSQSIFVVQIAIYNKLGQLDQSTPAYTNCGYSPIAIICTVLMSIVLCIVAIFFMTRKMPEGSPPVVSSCSAAISAACHVPPGLRSDAMIYGKLRWGVTTYSPGIGHCSLAPADAWEVGGVGHPLVNIYYAGIKES